MSTLQEVAAAVVSELNAGTWDQAFTAVKTYRPTADIVVPGLLVEVVPTGHEVDLEARDTRRHEYTVSVSVAKKETTPGDDAEVDDLLDLVDAIVDYMTARPLADAADASWIDTQRERVMLFDELTQKNVFAAIVRFRYLVCK